MEKQTLFDTDICGRIAPSSRFARICPLGAAWRGSLANRVLKFFRDSNGNIVIAQPPNPPIIVWGVASLLELIFTSGLTNVGLDLIAFGSLFTWAWLELFQGQRARADRRKTTRGHSPSHYFRRTLGFVVLVGFIGFRILSNNTI